jgi:hypothetical protein
MNRPALRIACEKEPPSARMLSMPPTIEIAIVSTP